MLVGAAIGFVFVCALLVLWWRFAPKTSAPATAPQPQNVVTYSTNAPSEEPATAQTYRSSATGDQPKYMRLPTIHAEGYIEAVGLDQHGAVAVPSNINLAGWYVNTLTPGQNGLSVIDGHVNGQKLPGVFADLAKLAAEDTFEVELANGIIEHFTVKSVNQVPADTAATTLFSRDNSIFSQLNLITCGGDFDHAKGVYRDRIIVVAALQNH